LKYCDAIWEQTANGENKSQPTEEGETGLVDSNKELVILD